MTNNNRIYEIMQEIITEKMIEESIEENTCENKWRKISISLFFKYLFLAAISKSKSYRETAKVGIHQGLTKVDYSSLSLKGKKIDYRVFKSLYKKLIEKVNRNQRRTITKKMKKVIKSVDATLLKAATGKVEVCTIYKNNKCNKITCKNSKRYSNAGFSRRKCIKSI